MRNRITGVSTTPDRAHDLLRFEHRPLDVFFRPSSVAVVGATETPGSVGRTLFQNLITSRFGGEVTPINPRRDSVFGVKAYPLLSDMPSPPDLVVIATPAAMVPELIRGCVDVGAKGAIIISAGFKEIGVDGAALESRVLQEARRGNLRLIGPNCLGVMNPVTGLNATFAQAMAHPGNVAFLSQSGALCTAILDWSLQVGVGFSAFMSIGSMLDVGWADLIDHLGNDPHTESIILYMESIGDAHSFMSAAREVAMTKPIVVIKAGRTAVGARAAASHTGSLTGSDEVLDAAFRRCGVLRVERIEDLFLMAELLARQPRPAGPRLSILTNAGGPGVLAADALISAGGELAELSEETVKTLDSELPQHWSRHNPIDVLGDAGPERYASTLEVAARDKNSQGLLVILTPQAMTDPTGTAQKLAPYARIEGKPVIASWMGGPCVADGQAILEKAGIPVFAYPDTAARMFSMMWRYTSNLRSLYETPSLPRSSAEPGREIAAALVNRVRQAGRTLLTEIESKELLAAYGLPVVPTRVAESSAAAVGLADSLGYPVVLKLHSDTITHKTDVGGVQLNLGGADAVRSAFDAIEVSVRERAGEGHFQGVTVQPMVRTDGYELILGSSVDPQFGPVLLFGTGGQLVEVFKDRALALPPLDSTLARRAMEQTKIYTALKGVRGRSPVDVDALEQIFVRFSQLVTEQRWIKEIDINPLLASAGSIVALDARVVLFGGDTTEAQLPTLPIRPYPVQYTSSWKTPDGVAVIIRPIRSEDEPLVARFHENLSEQTVSHYYSRKLELKDRVAHDRLVRICHVDYDREIALVAVRTDSSAGVDEIMAIGRLSKRRTADDAELTLLVGDAWQGIGLGTEMTRRLVEVARMEKVRRVFAVMRSDNEGMKSVCSRLGFRIGAPDASDQITAEIVSG